MNLKNVVSRIPSQGHMTYRIRIFYCQVSGHVALPDISSGSLVIMNKLIFLRTDPIFSQFFH